MIDSESKLEKYAKRELQNVGCLVYKFSSPAKRGVPDSIVVAPNGFIFFIEYKSPNGTGELSKLQKIEHEKLVSKGATVLVIDSVCELDYVLKGLKDGSNV